MIDQTITQLLDCPKDRYVGNDYTFGLIFKYYADIKILFKVIDIFDRVNLNKDTLQYCRRFQL